MMADRGQSLRTPTLSVDGGFLIQRANLELLSDWWVCDKR